MEFDHMESIHGHQNIFDSNKMAIFMGSLSTYWISISIWIWIFIAFVAQNIHIRLRLFTQMVFFFSHTFLKGIMRINSKGTHWLCVNDFLFRLLWRQKERKRKKIMRAEKKQFLGWIAFFVMLKVILRMCATMWISFVVFFTLEFCNAMQFKRMILSTKLCITKHKNCCNNCSNVKLHRFAMFLAQRML